MGTMIVSKHYLERFQKNSIFSERLTSQRTQPLEFSSYGIECMTLTVRKGREHYSLERPGWQHKCTISLQEVEGTLEEREEEGVMVDEVPIGETRKSLRTVSSAENLTIGVGSALKRITSV